MNGRLKKIILLVLAVALLVGATVTQRGLNRDRETLGLTRVAPLENAPPMLAFTTVALGGFRGLIANALWIRATELQEEDKFFEMAQLADWITKLEPHFVQVWTVQAWNMSYNISVKFKDFDDRWRWVQRGINLLRDEGLKYNPNETLIYRELAWQFQHKMGANLDDANMVYKQEWLQEMSAIFSNQPPNYQVLTNPTTEDAVRRVTLLTNKYKMDPLFMKQVDEQFGPLEWRLPEAHAIYWAALGLEKARQNPTKVKADELIQLRRVVFQSMQLAFQRGKLIEDNFTRTFDFGPNLDIVDKVTAAYEQVMRDEPGQADHISTGHRNFLGNAVYFLYAEGRIPEALQWYRYLGQKYPNKPLLSNNTNSLPANTTLEEFCLSRIAEDVSETSRDRVTAILFGHAARGYEQLIRENQKQFADLRALSRMLHATYMKKIAGGANIERIGLQPVEEIEQQVLQRILDPTQSQWSFEMRAALRAKLGMEPEPPPTPAPSATNAAPATVTPPN